MAQTATPVDNGVNVEALLGAREALSQAPEAAQFKWRAECKWVNGTHSQTSINSFFGLGGEQNCFLMQPVRIKTRIVFKQGSDLLAQPQPYGLGPAPRGCVGARNQGRNFREAVAQHPAQRLAFMPPHLREAGERGAPTLLVRTDPSTGLDDAAAEELAAWADRQALRRA